MLSSEYVYAGLLLVFLSATISYSQPTCPQPYSTCPQGKPGAINVHIIAHTHDDVGWLATVDEYYYGRDITGVQYILDNLIPELEKDPSKRFIYVEIAYLARWWQEQNNQTKETVRKLVQEGRLEFTNAGWCQNDEATTYYQDIIDQMSLGLKFIKDEFGECARPRIAWQVDPFGHSREMAALFAQFGYDGLFVGRDDWVEETWRAATRTKEMIWRGSPSLGKSGDIFNGILPINYGPYPTLCFDSQCRDDPIVDNPDSDEYNLDLKLGLFVGAAELLSQEFRTKNFIMTFGGDFQFSNARKNFENIDKLIYHANQIQNITNLNVFYSTPGCYLYALYKENITWPVKEDDFFPYANRPHSYWTGYFTSRAALKDYVRRANNIYQAVRQLVVFANFTDQATRDKLSVFEDALGVAQHHDAVSGTEKQRVANDYSKRLSNGIIQATDLISRAILGNNGQTGDLSGKLFICQLLNISECIPIENQQSFNMVVYNPLARSVNSWISIPLVDSGYVVKQINSSSSGELSLEEVLIDSEMVPVKSETKAIPERSSKANYELVFNAQLPALGFVMYSVEKGQSKEDKPSNVPSSSKLIEKMMKRKKNMSKSNDVVSIENEHLRLLFDNSGNLNEIVGQDKSTSNLKASLRNEFCYYKSHTGDNKKGENQASGAYIFRPQEDTPICYQVTNFTVYKGKLFEEVHQVFNDWLSQTIRLYKNTPHVEFDWQVGPINVDDKVGKEVIFKINTDLKSNKFFSTDSNGRQILKRKRDFKASIPDYYLTERVSGNYYPVNSRILLQDEEGSGTRRQITLVTDRSQGGSSLEDGSLELMVQRRILFDDGLGVHDPLNELGLDSMGLRVKGKINLIFNTTTQSARIHRDWSHKINSQPLLTFITNNGASNQVSKVLENLSRLNHIVKRSNDDIQDILPRNVHLLTLQKEYNNSADSQSLILRLEHFYELNEDAEYSKEVQIDLQSIFDAKSIQIMNIDELSLGANMGVSELDKRLVFRPQSDTFREDSTLHREKVSFKQNSPYVINLQPFQIRTFRVTYIHK